MVRRSKIEIDLYNPYSLDWGEEISFPSSRNVKEYGNRIYNRYPARSIFLVPRAILASIGKNHLNVLDPFMGSGTTAVETVISGNNPYGLEMDPFARMVAEVSSTIFSKSEQTEIKNVLTTLIDNWKTYEEAEIPNLTGIKRWFKKEDLSYLLKLKSAIISIVPKNYQPFFMVTYADAIKPVSLIERQSLKPYISTKYPKETKDVESSFLYSFDVHFAAMQEMLSSKKTARRISWIGDDATTNNKKKPIIDIAISSPPYINALDYTRCIKVESAFCGTIDNNIAYKLREKQVGHERRRAQDIFEVVKNYFTPYYDKIVDSDKQRALTCQAYFNDMYKNLKCVYNVLRKHGEYHVIIGDNTIKGVEIPTHEVIRQLALEVGFECFGYYKYVIKDHRTSIPRNKKNSKIEYEHVIMLRKL